MTAPQVATAHRLPENTYLRRHVDLLPGYRDALKLAEQADAELRNLPAVPDVPADLDPFTTGRITPEWLDAVDDHETSVAKYEKHRQRILTVKQRATGNAMSIFTGKINWLLRGLGDDLTQLMAEIADVDRALDGAETAEQAITLGVTDPWKRLCDLADDYSTLRSAQDYLMISVAPRQYWASCRPILGGSDTANLAHIRNLDDVWPDWRQPGMRTQHINVEGGKPRSEPWPADSGPELLLWLHRSPAEPWLPSLTEIDSLFREMREADNPAFQPRPERLLLNEPSSSHFDRIAPELKSVDAPAELAELGAAFDE